MARNFSALGARGKIARISCTVKRLLQRYLKQALPIFAHLTSALVQSDIPVWHRGASYDPPDS